MTSLTTDAPVATAPPVDATGDQPLQQLGVLGPGGPPPGAVAVVVDESVAAVAAARCAARIAREHSRALVVVVLVPAASSVTADAATDDAAALLARVQPALDRSGVDRSVRTCPDARAWTASRSVRRTARNVRRCLPDDVGLLVCPADGAVPGHTALAAALAQDRRCALLAVPDLPAAASRRGAGAVTSGPSRPTWRRS